MNPRAVAFLAVAASAAACSAPLPASVSRSSISGGTVDTAHSTVLGIELLAEHDVCTGSLIAPTLVLTARHCVGDIVRRDSLCGDGTDGGISSDVTGPTYPVTDFDVTLHSTTAVPRD